MVLRKFDIKLYVNHRIISATILSVYLWFSNVCGHQHQPEGLLKQGLLGLLSEFLIQQAWGWGDRICISHKLPGDAPVAAHCENPQCAQ